MHVVSCRELSGDEGHTKVHATVRADSATSSNVNCTFKVQWPGDVLKLTLPHKRLGLILRDPLHFEHSYT